jgi:hypothetical protein
MRLTTPAVLLLALATAVSGCGGGANDKPDAAATRSATSTPSVTPTSTPTPTAAGTIDPSVDCATMFSRGAAVKLAAEKVAAPTREAFSGLTACRWTSTSTGAWVQVLAVPASEWAKVLPSAIGTVLDSDLQFEGRDKLDQALTLVKAGGKLSNSRACGIFSTMVTSLQGQPKGSTRVFNYVPNAQVPEAVNGQACVGGRYFSVQFTSSTLKAGPAVNKRIKSALASLTG